jgi:cobalt/nickel transport protein
VVFLFLGAAMKRIFIISTLSFILLFSSTVYAHFGMVIPSDSMVMQHDKRVVSVDLSFSHPFEMVGMDLDLPSKFYVFHNGKKSSLLSRLKNSQVMGRKSFTMDYRIKRPGIYAFMMEPKPYWEEAEDCFIIHYTKTVVAAFGDDEGWGVETGAITEIVPMSKPFGLYAGNLFQGVVKLQGKAVPYAEVEVEYYNSEKNAKAPTDYMITQTVKADKNGVFSYAVPSSGWWGFSALNKAPYKIKHNGKPKDVELGAVLWVKFHKFGK